MPRPSAWRKTGARLTSIIHSYTDLAVNIFYKLRVSVGDGEPRLKFSSIFGYNGQDKKV